MARELSVRLELNKSAFTAKEVAEANKRYKEKYSGAEDPEAFLLWDFKIPEQTKGQDEEKPRYDWELIRDDEAMSFYIWTPIGIVDVEIPMKLDVQLTLLENLVKKANKVKTMLEAVS